jgi:hypothetical protein
MAIKFPLLIHCASTSSGTGPFTILETTGAGGVVGAGYRSFTLAVSEGHIDGITDQVFYIARDSTVENASGLYEYGIGTFNNSTKHLSRDTILQSSNGTSIVSFGAGRRDIYVSDSFAALFLQAANNLTDLPNVPAARVALGLGTAALATIGTASGDVPELDSGGQIPASMLGHAPSAEFTSGTKVAFVQDAVPGNGLWTQVTGIDDAVFMCTSGSGHAGSVAGGVYTSNSTGLNSWQVSWALAVANHALTANEVNLNQSFAAGAGAVSCFAFSSPGAGHNHNITDGKTWRPPSLTQCVGARV